MHFDGIEEPNRFEAILSASEKLFGALVNDGSVMKLALNGGAPTTLVSAQPAPLAIGVDATDVYWATGQALARSQAAHGDIPHFRAQLGYRRAPTTTSVAWAPPVPFTASASRRT